MKKLLALLLVFLMLISAVVGCSEAGNGESSELTSSEELSADFEDVEDTESEEEFEEEEEVEDEESFDETEEELEEEEFEDEESFDETEEEEVVVNPEEEKTEEEPEEEKVDEESSESESSEPSKKPVSPKPESSKPSKKPVSSKPESSKPESSELESSEPESSEPESSEPSKKPVSSKPESSEPSKKPVSSKPESSKPESSKPESSEPESSKPESSEPESSKPEKEPLSPEEQRLEKMLLGEDEEFNKDAIYHEGNLARLAKAMKKSKSDEEVTIVCYGNDANTGRYMGGSVDTPYSSIIKSWWTENIGPCKVIESGLDLLTSINACMRVEYDVLTYKPDLVFLDFSVQDAISSLAKTNSKGFDNLVRRILESETSPAVIELLLTGADQYSYTMNPSNANMFVTAAVQHKEVAKWYDIPVIDFEEAVWENFIELVKVTTKKEEPLITWKTISSATNIKMNNSGHAILGGAITYFLEGVLQKLDKIPTTIPAIPEETCYGEDKYMKGSFITVGDIIDGPAKDKGYAFNMDVDEMEEYEYAYSQRRDTGSSATNSLLPSITTYRHYIPADDSEAEQSVAVAGKYLELTVPEITVNSETYFMLTTTKDVSTKNISNSNILKFAPVSFVCYNSAGDVISTLKAPSANFTETTSNGKTSAVKLPVGTTKIEIKIYTRGGSVKLLGIGQFETSE